jgi:hypothetical protein
MRVGEDQFAFVRDHLALFLGGFRLDLGNGLWPFSNRWNMYRFEPDFCALADKTLF